MNPYVAHYARIALSERSIADLDEHCRLYAKRVKVHRGRIVGILRE